jgi:hypothetical protein
LARLCRQSHTPFLKQVKTFPDGEALFDHCNQFGFEGVCFQAPGSRLLDGPSRPLGQGQRDNAERVRLQITIVKCWVF